MPSTSNITLQYNKNKPLFTIIKISLFVIALILKFSFPGNIVFNNILFVLKVILLVSLISDYFQSKRLLTSITLEDNKIKMPFVINSTPLEIPYSAIKDFSVFSTYKRTLKITTSEKTYVLEELKMKQSEFDTLMEELNKRVNLNSILK